MPEKLQPTTILEGTIGIPKVTVVTEPASAAPRGAGRITVNTLQQANNRLSEEQLEDMQAKQRSQRKLALGY